MSTVVDSFAAKPLWWWWNRWANSFVASAQSLPLRDIKRWILRIVGIYLFHKMVVRRWLNRHPHLTYDKASPIASFLAERLTSVKTYFPTPWLLGGIIQSGICGMRGIETDNSLRIYRREILQMPKIQRPPGVQCCPAEVPHGVVSFDWVLPASEADPATSTAPVVVIVPGLTGDSSQVYVRVLANALCKRGVRVACFNPRGRGGNELVSPFFYSGGWILDLSRTVSYIRQNVHQDTCMYGVGFSLGSNYLAKMVGEYGDACELDGAIMLACPLDMLSMTLEMKNTVQGRLMDPILANNVQKVREEFEPQIKTHPKLDMNAIKNASTMSDFDHHATARMFDFTCASDYYRYASCSLNLHQIRRPCVFVHASNDPICPGRVVFLDSFESNKYLLHVMTSEGGHSMVWPTGLKGESWVANVVCEIVDLFGTDEFADVALKQQSLDENEVNNPRCFGLP